MSKRRMSAPRWLGPILGLALISGCTSAPEINHAVDRLKPLTAEEMRTRRDLLVGTWYGEALTNEGQTRSEERRVGKELRTQWRRRRRTKPKMRKRGGTRGT